MKAKQRQLLALLAVLAVLAGAFSLLTWSSRKAAAESEARLQGSISLSTLSAEEIDAIRYEYDGEMVWLTRQDDRWTLDSDPGYRVSQTTVQAMADALEGLAALRGIGDVIDYADYGLEVPAFAVTACAGGQELTLRFGSENPLTGDQYLQVAGDAVVYTVTADCQTVFRYGKADLFEPFSPLEVTVGSVQALAYTYNDTAGCFEVALTRVSEDDTTAWKLAGNEASAVQQALVSVMLNRLTGDVLQQITAPEAEAVYGLDAPALTVTLTDADGVTHTVRVGRGSDGCYLAVEGDTGVYAVETELLSAFAYAADDLLEASAADENGA